LDDPEHTGAGEEQLGTLGRYQLIAKLASGGMGEIFLARLAAEGGFEKLIVLKRLLPALVASEHFVSMFLDEARIAAKLSHTNVCEVHELGRDGAQYFIAMQYLEGVPLTQAMPRPEGGDEATHLRLVAGLVQQACEGLHHAHEQTDADGQPLGVVHRDVSPSNLFVTAEGVVKVLDFGIAKARGATSQTEQGMIKGKYSYMSPEQVRGDALDRRSDVFALGIVSYEAVTGVRLFKRASDYLVAKAILEEPIPRADEARPGVPKPVADAIARALDRDIQQRHPTARALGAALAEAVRDIGGPMTPTEIAAEVERRFDAELGVQRARYAEASALAEAATQSYPRVAAPKPAAIATRPTVYARPTPRERAMSGGWLGAVLLIASVVAAGAVGWWAWRATSPRETSTLPIPNRDPTTVVARPLAAPDAAPLPPDASPVGPPDAAPATQPRPRPALKYGYISIESKPWWAKIYVDGDYAGQTPLIRHRVRAGRRKIRAVTEDGRKRTFDLDVPANNSAPPQNLTWQ
jgi:serine/threonine-protein kinase